MSVERSGRGALTTNAITYQYYDYTLQNFITSTGQWTQEDNYSISRRFNPPVPAVSGQTYQIDKVVFSGYSGLGYDLVYSVVVYQGSTKVFESGFSPNNTETSIYTPTMSYGDSPTKYAIVIWVMRSDGNTLSRQDMRPSTVNCNARFYQPVEVTTAIPQNWLETTTQSIPTYTTQTTMLTTVDYESYLSTLTVPSDVRPAIAQLDQLINDLWSLHYIPFVVCFALIMGLAIWLLH